MYTPVNPSFTILKWGLRGQNYIGMFSGCASNQAFIDSRWDHNKKGVL